MKNARLLNQLGEELGEKYGVAHLPSDFKKEGRLQTLDRAFQGVRFVPPGLLRLRLSRAQRQREKERKDQLASIS